MEVKNMTEKNEQRDIETLKKLEEICAGIRMARDLPQDKIISLAQGKEIRVIFNDQQNRQYSLIVENDLSDRKIRLELPDGRYLEIDGIPNPAEDVYPVQIYSGNKLTHDINNYKTRATLEKVTGEMRITDRRND